MKGPTENISPHTEAPSSRRSRKRRLLQFRLSSLFVMVVLLAMGFYCLRIYLDNRPIVWEAFSQGALEEHLSDGRTVLVNFRATWTVSTVMHEAVALERPEVRRSLRAHGVVAMRADLTNESPQIRAALNALGQPGVPVVAIYPANSPDEPIVLTGKITQEQVLLAIEEAQRRRTP